MSTIIKHTVVVTALIGAWISIAILVMITGSMATAAVPHGTSLPANVAIIDKTTHLLTVRSDEPDFVRQLYENGALFVLPARQKTCLSLQGV